MIERPVLPVLGIDLTVRNSRFAVGLDILFARLSPPPGCTEPATRRRGAPPNNLNLRTRALPRRGLFGLHRFDAQKFPHPDA
jgi:hypothetical protein